MIVGSQHFVTFDQRHYDFKGHCSYLLANDFVGHEFSLVLNYESEIKGHYTMLLLLGSETISIDLQRRVSWYFFNKLIKFAKVLIKIMVRFKILKTLKRSRIQI